MIYSNNNKCTRCGGSGKIIVSMSTDWTKEVYNDNREVDFVEQCPECNGGMAARTAEVKQRANIPASYYEAGIEEFKWDIYRDATGKQEDLEKQALIVSKFIDCYDSFEGRGLGLYIYSQMKGSGKTFLASCICNELMAKYSTLTKFVSASALIDIDQSKRDYGTEYDRDPIERLCKCRLLVIDDLGQQGKASEWLNNILFRIMDERMQNKLVTIITSNVKISELAYRNIDDRVSSRISKACALLPLPEYDVRERESITEQIELYKELGIID